VLNVPEQYLHPKWRDMSEWVVHFTGTEYALKSILADRLINAGGPFGQGRTITEVRDAHMSACLSEIPLDHLDRLYQRHGRWGLGFRKEFVTRSGGARVWYVDVNSDAGEAVFAAVRTLLKRQDFDSDLWRMTPFIDSMADGEPYLYRFDWEREWRVPGGLSFELSDIAFVMTPENGFVAGRELLDAEGIGVISSTSPTSFGINAVEVLGSDLDEMIARFLESFIDPVEVLPWDSEDGTYVWLVSEWTTEDAVGHIFDAREVDTTSLVDELNLLSPAWVSQSELETIHE
jgi:hypothetical protein